MDAFKRFNVNNFFILSRKLKKSLNIYAKRNLSLANISIANDKNLKFLIIFLFSFYQTYRANRSKTLFALKEKEKAKEKSIFEEFEQRVGIVQTNANEPIEDRSSAFMLKHLKGIFLSVLDGHGGPQMAHFANERLHLYFDNFYKEIKAKEKTKTEDEIIVDSLLKSFAKVENEFYLLAKEIYAKGNGRLASVGSCATVCIIANDKLYIANAGDSKTKLYRRNAPSGVFSLSEQSYERIKLSTTHNAEKELQQKMLKEEFKDESDIVVCKRPNNKVCYVKGRLQPTRSLGDFHLKYLEFNNPKNNSNPNFRKSLKDFKGPYIKAVPEVRIHEIQNNDEYIVMGTDGLWDELSSQDVGEVIFKSDKKNYSVSESANMLINAALKKAAENSKMNIEDMMKIPAGGVKRKIHDDITIVLFNLKNNL